MLLFLKLSWAKACVAIPEIKLNGKVLGSYYAGAVEGSISVSDLALEGTHADRMGKTSLDFKVGYDNGDISVDKLNLNADGFGLSANGKAKLSDSIFVDMGVGLTNMDFGRLTAYISPILFSPATDSLPLEAFSTLKPTSKVLFTTPSCSPQLRQVWISEMDSSKPPRTPLSKH